MRSYLDSKAMAKTLRQALAERGLDIPHSAALELVARQFGVADWNTLAARIEAETDRELIVPEGWMATGEGQNGYRLGRDPDAAGALPPRRPLRLPRRLARGLRGTHGVGAPVDRVARAGPGAGLPPSGVTGRRCSAASSPATKARRRACRL